MTGGRGPRTQVLVALCAAGLALFNFPLLIVQVNGALVDRAAYETTVVRDGDEVDLHHLVSGG